VHSKMALAVAWIAAIAACQHAPAPIPSAERPAVVPSVERRTVRSVHFAGAQRVSAIDLEAVVRPVLGNFLEFQPGAELDVSHLVDRGAVAIKLAYFDRGFALADAAGHVAVTPDGGAVDVSYEIREGEQFKLRKIHFGNGFPLGADSLKSLMSSQEGQVCSRSKLQADIRLLTDLCHNNHFPSATITPNTSIAVETKTVDVTLEVELGNPAPARPPPPAHAPTRAPITWVKQFPIAEVTINGRGPFSFLVDTGASRCVVSLELARALGLDVRMSNEGVFDASGTTNATLGHIELQQIGLGDRRFTSVPAQVLDLSFAARTLNHSISGVLGLELFRDLVLVIDYPASILELTDAAVPPPDDNEVLAAVQSPRGLMLLEVGIGNRKMAVYLDSGDDGFMEIDRSVWDQYPWTSEPITVAKFVSVSGQIRDARSSRLGGSVEVGAYSLLHPVVGQTDAGSRLAGSFMKEFRVSLDQARGRIRFERPRRQAIRCPSVKTLGIGIIWKHPGASVAYVLDASPAAKEIRVGDGIRAIDGRTPDAYDATALTRLFESKSVVHLSMERNGSPYELDAPVLEFLPEE
jgi:hypothetical protein